MAIPIKAIPTLYGEEATRMMKSINEAERHFEERKKQPMSQEKDRFYEAMLKFLRKSDGYV